MAYTKNIWKDQIVERPKTYEMTNNPDGSVTLVDSFGLVTELGTPVNADNMNHIEDGVAACDLTKYSGTKSYSENEWVTGIVDNEKSIYISLEDDNLGNPLTDTTKWKKMAIGSGTGAGLNMFDTVFKDHILSFEESKGLALLGTYVYKTPVAGSRYGYPNFYNECVTQKTAGTATQITLGETTITTYNNANGHIFYNIADKAAVDAFYNIFGACWMYGIDTENERIFLPRNDWFTQNGSPEDVGKFIEAGLPNITGSANISRGDSYSWQVKNPSGCFYNTAAYPGVSETSSKVSSNSGLGFNASAASSIYGNSDTVQPAAVKKLVYMVVGNTETVNTVTVELTSDSAMAPISFNTETGAIKLNYADGLSLDSDGNLTGLTKSQAVDACMPDYSAGVTVSGFPYTAPKSGYLCFVVNPPGSNVNLLVNNNVVSVFSVRNGQPWTHNVELLVSKNDVISASNNNLVSNITFFPMKGANNA